MPRDTEPRTPEHEKTPRERVMGFEKVIRSLGHGERIKVSRYALDPDVVELPPQIPRVQPIPNEGTVAQFTVAFDGSRMSFQFVFGEEGDCYQLVSTQHGLPIGSRSVFHILKSLQDKGFEITTPEKKFGEHDKAVTEKELEAGFTIATREMFQTGWQIPHDPALQGATNLDPREYTHIGMRTIFTTAGDVARVIVKRTETKDEPFLEGLSDQELALTDAWVFTPDGRTQYFEERGYTPRQWESMRHGTPVDIVATLSSIIEKQAKVNDRDVKEGTISAYPYKEREGAGLLHDRASTLAVDAYRRLADDLQEEIDPEAAETNQRVEARRRAVDLLYDDGVGLPRAQIEQTLGITAQMLREDISALRDLSGKEPVVGETATPSISEQEDSRGTTVYPFRSHQKGK